jgi:hypothetical protein
MVPPTSAICKEGQSSCEKCVDGLKEKICPLCRDPIKKKANLVLDKIIRRIRFPCENRQLGYEESFYINDIFHHEYKCMYKFITCPLSVVEECTWNGIRKDLKEHLFTYHRHSIEEFEAGESRNIFESVSSPKDEFYCDRIIVASGEMFLHSNICTPTLFCCIVQYVCPKVKESHYGYRIVFSREGHKDVYAEDVVSSNIHDLCYLREKKLYILRPSNQLEMFYYFNTRGVREVTYSLEIFEFENSYLFDGFSLMDE